jgi:hypothetical protein
MSNVLARSMVEDEPDAYVLAEAIGAEPDWFITPDNKRFLKERKVTNLNFPFGTPGDLIQSISDGLIPP